MVVPSLEIFAFLLEKSFISETGRSQGHVPKGLHEHLFYISCDGKSNPLSPSSSVSSVMKTAENTEEDPADLESADGDIQVEYYSN